MDEGEESGFADGFAENSALGFALGKALGVARIVEALKPNSAVIQAKERIERAIAHNSLEEARNELAMLQNLLKDMGFDLESPPNIVKV